MAHTYRCGTAENPLPEGVGLDLSGFLARDNPSTGQRDELRVRAIFLGDGETAVAWASADVLAISSLSANRIRKLVAARNRNAPRTISISATHTHSAPATVFLANCGAVSRAWLKQFEDVVAMTIVQAITNARTPVHLEFASAETPGFSYNRRALTADGSITMGSVPDDLVKRRGPLDATLSVITAKDAQTSRPVAAILHFACHAVFMCSRTITADWPGVMLQRVREAIGGDFTPLFVQGACGDINPVNQLGDAVGEERATISEQNMIRMGEGMAAKAISCIVSRGERQPGKIGWNAREAALPWRTIPTVEELRARLLSPADLTAATREQQARHLSAKRLLAQHARGRLGRAAKMPVQAVRMGNILIAALGGEIMTQTALDIASAHPAFHTLVAAYANGSSGYLAPAEEYAYGGYEIERAFMYYGNPDAFVPEAEAVVRAEVDKAAAAAGG
jgi:hypothetical protein